MLLFLTVLRGVIASLLPLPVINLRTVEVRACRAVFLSLISELFRTECVAFTEQVKARLNERRTTSDRRSFSWTGEGTRVLYPTGGTLGTAQPPCMPPYTPPWVHPVYTMPTTGTTVSTLGVLVSSNDALGSVLLAQPGQTSLDIPALTFLLQFGQSDLV